jgi:cytochrome P450
VLGNSLLTDEGDSWQHHRTMLNPIFAKRHLNDLVELMIEPIQAAVDRLDARGGRVEFDMVDQMVELTLNVVGNALFSQQFGGIAEGMSGMATRALRFAERLERVFLIAAPPTDVFRALVRVGSSDLPIPSPLPRIDALMKSFDSAVWSVVNERNAHRTDTPDLLNHLLNARSEDGAPLPLQRVRDEALTFMLAGHETTANALSWMWYLLALNPHARAKMLAEVDDVLLGRRPTVDDLAALPWTQACFQEAMRYFSPVWAIARVAIDDDVIGRHHIRKGTTIIIPVHLLHHDDRWWPNPEEYNPSRFLPGAGKGRPRSAYLPFGGGKRICIGSSFALMESVLITAMMSQRFVFDLVAGHPVDPEATLTLRPRHGVKTIARRRKGKA